MADMAGHSPRRERINLIPLMAFLKQIKCCGHAAMWSDRPLLSAAETWLMNKGQFRVQPCWKPHACCQWRAFSGQGL
jgi:hypothetical protein